MLDYADASRHANMFTLLLRHEIRLFITTLLYSATPCSVFDISRAIYAMFFTLIFYYDTLTSLFFSLIRAAAIRRYCHFIEDTSISQPYAIR